MIENATSKLYQDDDKAQNSEPEGEIELTTAPKAGTRNNAPTPHFVTSMPSSDLRTSAQSGQGDLAQAAHVALSGRGPLAEAYSKVTPLPERLKQLQVPENVAEQEASEDELEFPAQKAKRGSHD